MPHFMISVIDASTSSATPAEMERIDAFNAQLIEEGRWVQAAGLAHPREARIVDGRGENASVTEGALHTGAEFLSGFWIVTAPDRDTATHVAVQASRACGRRVELREFLGG